tara:strand:+ start:264 stop:596 length:333 start_codon:yes stop_codon:yes gene_type:complete
MIENGINGSISGFYKGKLIVSRPLGKDRTLESYKNDADLLIREAMELGHTIGQLIKFNLGFVKIIRYKNYQKEPNQQDKDIILNAILTLIRFKIIDEFGDKEGLLLQPLK